MTDSEPPAYRASYGSTSGMSADEASAPPYDGLANRGSSNGELANGGPPNYTYEELSDGFTCPTCQGTGKIPREREDDLVALIPYSDARLKPRRTVCYVTLSIFTCTAIAGILIAFLLPRAISFQQDGKVTTVFASYNETVPTMTLVLETEFDIYNYNFASIRGQSLSITGSWSEQVKGTNITALNDTIGGRESYHFSGNVTVTFTDGVAVSHCADTSITHLIYMQFIATFQYGLLSQSQQSTITFYKTVNCKPVKEAPWQRSPDASNRWSSTHQKPK